MKDDGAAGLQLRIETVRGSGFSAAYQAGEPRATEFFEYPPGSRSALRAKAAEIDRRFDRATRLRAVRCLEGELSPALERWVEEGGYMVTTGQQPALFGGPLYCVVKALAAVRLAAWAQEALDRPVLPVYWMASEDHDWDEADHIEIISPGNELHRISLPPPDTHRRPPLSRIQLGPGVDGCVERLRSLLPANEWSRLYVEMTADAFAPGAIFSEACLRLLQGLLGRFGVRFVDAASLRVKEASAPMLADELGRATESEELLEATGREISRRGFALQVPVLEGAVNLFLDGPAGRERLYRDGAGFRLRTSGRRLSLDDVLARQHHDPGSLSPNVLLRPVVESALLPTLAYVAGPGEIAYFAQLRPYFERLGVGMPVVHPRPGVVPVEAKIAKVLVKFGLEPDDLGRPLHEIAATFAREATPEAVRNHLAELRRGAGSSLAALDRDARSLDPTLAGPTRQARSSIFGALAELERKIAGAVKRESRIALTQIEKAAIHLFPRGVPAERVQSPLYYLGRYGDGFLDRLAAEASPPKLG